MIELVSPRDVITLYRNWQADVLIITRAVMDTITDGSDQLNEANAAILELLSQEPVVKNTVADYYYVNNGVMDQNIETITKYLNV